jgi:hypothetical protein
VQTLIRILHLGSWNLRVATRLSEIDLLDIEIRLHLVHVVVHVLLAASNLLLVEIWINPDLIAQH